MSDLATTEFQVQTVAALLIGESDDFWFHVPFTDCNGNGLHDIPEVLDDPSLDDGSLCGAGANNNFMDECDCADCNNNGLADAIDIDLGTSTDTNSNGIPDECECPWDLDGNGSVGSEDVAVLLGAWGFNPGHAGDFDADGLVSASDLASMLSAWGPCPFT